MTCSPERLAANRRNSLKSTGPTTPEGKARSSRNSLKHGLTGEGIVIPDEDAAEVEHRIASFEHDLRPANDLARALARHAAVLSVRLERAARNEAAEIGRKMIHAEADEAGAHLQQVEDWIATIADQPALTRHRLLRTPEGIDRMIECWEGLKAVLGEGRPDAWTRDHLGLAENLTGRRRDAFSISTFARLTLVAEGDFRLAPGDGTTPYSPEAGRRAALAALSDVIDEVIEGLREAREALDFDAIARARAGAPQRAIFDPSREAALARGYEAAAERNFFRTLKEIERINQRELEDPSTPYDSGISDEVASSSGPPQAPPEPPPSPPQAAPIEAPSPPPAVPSPAPAPFQANPWHAYDIQHPPHYPRVGG